MKIVLATDGSAHSRHGLEQVAFLAHGRDVEVVVLSVSTLVDFSAYGPLNYTPQAVMEIPTESESTEILADAAKFLAERGVVAQTMRRVGPCAETILAVTEELGADLLVVGSHGRTGLTRFLMGSVSNQVLNHSTCSVLIAKGDVPPAASAGEPLPVSIAEKV